MGTMNKLLLIFVIFIMSALAVHASEYEVVYEIVDMHNATELGTTNVADIILNKNLINREIFSLNFTTQTIKQFDSIKVSGNSITIDGVTYSPGQEKVYDTEGLHTYCEVSNVTKCSSFTVVKLDNPTVNISISSADLSFDINNSAVTLDSEKVAQISLNVTSEMSPRNYFYDLSINNVTEQIHFEIEPIEVWGVIGKNFISVIDTGEHGVFGNITLESTGNTHTVVNVSITGTETILFVDKDILLYPHTPVTLEILYDVNKGREIGEYKTTITLNNVTIPINATIKDSVTPSLSEFNVSDVSIYSKTEFSFKAFDNLKINRSFIEYLEVNTTTRIQTNVTKFENDLFIDDITMFEKIGTYTAQACVADDSNNINCTDLVFFNVIKTDRVKISEQTIHFGKVKFGEYITAPLFNMTEGINVQIKLTHIEYDNNTEQWGMKVIDGDGKTEFILEPDKVITVGRVGEIKLAFMGNLEKQYTGIVEIIPDGYNINVTDVTFTGEVVDYNVPEEFEDVFYNRPRKCTVHFGDDVDSSYSECCIQYPITSDLQLESIPVTSADREEFVRSWEERLQVWKDKNSAKIGVIILFILCLLIAIGFVIWYSMFADRINLKFK